MNIILLAMSTLPDSPEKLRLNTFHVPCDGNAPAGMDVDDCRSQLEPVVRYYLRCISEYGKDKDIECLMLETDATSNDYNNYGITAADYFKQRINESKEAQGLSIKYHSIALQETHPVTAIKEAVTYIRDVQHSENENRQKISLYVDTHGGFRDVSLIMNAILSLLRQEKIRPRMICGVNTTTKSIIDQRYSFEIFSFVSGMNDFLNFGSADVIDDYYRSHGETSNNIEAVTNAMKKIAEGLQFCDITQYEDGLKEIQSSINAIEEDGNASDSMLGIFADTIKEDYGALLDENKRSVLDIIGRCIDNKLYQQALTFSESKIPQFLFDNRVFYFEQSEENKTMLRLAKSSTLKSYSDDVSYVFDGYLFSIRFARPVNNETRYTPINRVINEAARCGYDLTNEMDIDGQGITRDYKPYSFFVGEDITTVGMHEAERQLEVYSNVPPENAFMASEFIVLHKALKGIRNSYNHAHEDERPSYQSLMIAINRYLLLARELADCSPHPMSEVASSSAAERTDN